MNRRAFLQLITPVAAGVVLDPERLLWVPGKVFAFLGGGPRVEPVQMFYHHGNRLLTTEWVTKQIAREFVRSLEHLKAVNALYDRQFVEVGNTVTVRLPDRFRR